MEDGQKWLLKNKDHGMMSATASIGLILLWDVDGGLSQIDKYLYSPEDHIKAGALLACGIVNTGVRNGECWLVHRKSSIGSDSTSSSSFYMLVIRR